MKRKAKLVIKVWADLGPGGTPYVFAAGPVHSMYGPLLHVWANKISDDLIPVEIHIPHKRERGEGAKRT